MKIVSYTSKNPDRQVQLRRGVEEIFKSKPCTLAFPENETALYDEIRDAEIYLTWRLTESVFQRAERLKWVHIGNAGVEASLFPAVCKSDVIMTNARGIHGDYMAEWVLGALLFLTQRFSEAEKWKRDRLWREHKSVITRGKTLLKGQRALIVGYGPVGQAVAHSLSDLGVSCEAVARSERPEEIPVHPVSELQTIIGQFDIVVVALASTGETAGLFDSVLLNRMKPRSIFVNIARGSVVSESALIEALENGPLGGAALDVYAEEPLPETSSLFNLPNVFMTPHVSGNFHDYSERVYAFFIENLRNYVAGLPLKNLVDKERGY